MVQGAEFINNLIKALGFLTDILDMDIPNEDINTEIYAACNHLRKAYGLLGREISRNIDHHYKD